MCADSVCSRIYAAEDWDSETWLIRLEAQIAGLRMDDEVAMAVAETLAEPGAVVVPIDRGRIDHRRRQLALDVATGKVGALAFLAAIKRLSEADAGTGDGGRRGSVDAAKAVDYIRHFASSWARAKPATKATLVQSLYEEIVVRGAEFVSVRLTPEAYAHGRALALPQEVVVPAVPTRGRPRKGWALARPTLARPTGVGHALTAYRLPIEGREEWLAAVERLA